MVSHSWSQKSFPQVIHVSFPQLGEDMHTDHIFPIPFRIRTSGMDDDCLEARPEQLCGDELSLHHRHAGGRRQRKRSHQAVVTGAKQQQASANSAAIMAADNDVPERRRMSARKWNNERNFQSSCSSPPTLRSSLLGPCSILSRPFMLAFTPSDHALR